MKLSTTSFAAGAVAALVLGSGSAYAATGGNFILGKSNSAGATTTLSNANGTALSLNSKSGTAPLKVNRTTKVTNLNADLLDGRDSTYFARSAGDVGTYEGDGYYVDYNDDGTPDWVEAQAYCPTGYRLTGGGGEDRTSGGSLWSSIPWDGGWLVASTWNPAALPADDADTPRDATFADYEDASILVLATAQCYNPKGAATAAFRSQAQTLDSLHAAMAQKLAK